MFLKKHRRVFGSNITVFFLSAFLSSFFAFFRFVTPKSQKNLLKYTVKVSNNEIYFYIYRY